MFSFPSSRPQCVSIRYNYYIILFMVEKKRGGNCDRLYEHIIQNKNNRQFSGRVCVGCQCFLKEWYGKYQFLRVNSKKVKAEKLVF